MMADEVVNDCHINCKQTIISALLQAQDFEDPDVHHRHVSHLFGLFPGHTITVEKTPDLCKAADYTLYKRGLYVTTKCIILVSQSPEVISFFKASECHLYDCIYRPLYLCTPKQERMVRDGQLHGRLHCGHVFTAVSMRIVWSSI